MPGFREEKRGLAVWGWVGFAALAAVAVLAIVLWGRQYLPQPPGPPPPPQVRTYRNEEFGFTLDHPLEWRTASTSVMGTRAASAVAYFDGPENIARAEARHSGAPPVDIIESDIRVSVYPVSQIGNLDEYMIQGFKSGQVLNPRKLPADYPAYGFTPAGPAGKYTVLAENNRMIYEIFFGHRSSGEELKQREKDILKSFRFE